MKAEDSTQLRFSFAAEGQPVDHRFSPSTSRLVARIDRYTMSERRNSLSTIITADNRKEILFEMFGDIGELEEGNTTMHFILTVRRLLYGISIYKQRTLAAR
jgi:hypothetical protein